MVRLRQLSRRHAGEAGEAAVILQLETERDESRKELKQVKPVQ